METRSNQRNAFVAEALLLWLLAFTIWERIAALPLAAPSGLRRGLSGMACAFVTVVFFVHLAAKPARRSHLIAWGLTGAVALLGFSWWGTGLQQPQIVANLALLCAVAAAGWFFGEVVDSTAYVIPMLFAAAVDCALRTYAGHWASTVGYAGTYDCLWFPLLGSRRAAPVFTVSELLFLAVFLRAIERLGLGPSRGCVASIVSLTLFCLVSGVGELAAARCPLMVACFAAFQWRHVTTECKSAWAPVAFGLTFAGLMAILTWAGSLVRYYTQGHMPGR